MQELTPVQKAWLEALESGKYQQGQGRLRQGDKFCCLGVLAEIGIEHGLAIHKEEQNKNAPSGIIYSYNSGHHFLAPEICQLTGIKQEHQAGLAVMNDEGRTFVEIAKHIRENAENYFA